MKFSFATVASLLLAEHSMAFVGPMSPIYHMNQGRASSSTLHMAMEAPPVPQANTNLPVVQQNPYGQPSDVRYSDFLKLVNADRIEKVTFSSDGTQLLGVDVDGARLKIEALPNDPGLLTQLTEHKVRTSDCFLIVRNRNRDKLTSNSHCTQSLSACRSISMYEIMNRSMSLFCPHRKQAASASSPKA